MDDQRSSLFEEVGEFVWRLLPLAVSLLALS